MELSKLIYPSGAKEDYLMELLKHTEGDWKLQLGTAFLKKDTRTPFDSDYTRHEEVKIVCILEGIVQMELEDKKKEKVILKSGDVFKVNKREGHAGCILEDTKLIYVMFKKEVFPER